MRKSVKAVAIVGVAASTIIGVSGCRPALPPRDAAKPAQFTTSTIADQAGAAFTVVGELDGQLATQEIVTTAFAFGAPSGGPPPPLPGNVQTYSKAGGTWAQTTIVPASEGIIGPNRPTIADVDGDGKNDVIVPAGYFFSAISGPPGVGLPGGSITWWRNNGDGTYARNNVITGVVGSYHGVVFADFDKDGVQDIVSVMEDGGFPAYPFSGPKVPPTVRTEFFKGTGGGAFAAPVKIADGGGSLPAVFDIDGDGDFDVASAQYFGVKQTPISAGGPPFFAPVGLTDESFVWFENPGGAVGSAPFAKHVIASGLGESFQILPVDNIDGNGKYGAIGVNHVSGVGAPGTVQPQVVRLTPGSDVRAPWAVSLVADGFTVDDTRAGQAAPGFPSEGDLDGDGDIDLAVAGDSDWSIYLIERKAGGGWAKTDVAADYCVANSAPAQPGPPPVAAKNCGQGSVAIADLNWDGKNEIVFSSFNLGKIAVVERVAGTGGVVPAVPHQRDLRMPY